MTIQETMAAAGIETRDFDMVLISPDYALIKTRGKRNSKTKADKLIANIAQGLKIDPAELKDSNLTLCDDLRSAETEINRIATIIHDGKHGVGIHYSRIARNLIQCSLWRD